MSCSDCISGAALGFSCCQTLFLLNIPDFCLDGIQFTDTLQGFRGDVGGLFMHIVDFFSGHEPNAASVISSYNTR